jgi:HK97 family phage prohead protease
MTTPITLDELIAVGEHLKRTLPPERRRAAEEAAAHWLRHLQGWEQRPTPSAVKSATNVTVTHAVRDCALEFKALNDATGTFEGYLAVFGNVDGNGDVIDPGAFTKTLADHEAVKSRDHSPYLFPLLWQHNEKEPIGGFSTAREDTNGLFVRGQYDLDIPQGARAYSGAKKGYLRALSIGYDTIKSVFGSDARHLKEIRLWEGSPVTFPANDLALIEEVKARPTGGGGGGGGGKSWRDGPPQLIDVKSFPDLPPPPDLRPLWEQTAEALAAAGITAAFAEQRNDLARMPLERLLRAGPPQLR